jgi:hypothetical protein
MLATSNCTLRLVSTSALPWALESSAQSSALQSANLLASASVHSLVLQSSVLQMVSSSAWL